MPAVGVETQFFAEFAGFRNGCRGADSGNGRTRTYRAFRATGVRSSRPNETRGGTVSQVNDSFNSRKVLSVGDREYVYYSLVEAEKNGLQGVSRLPYSMKVLLENLLR